MKLALVRAGPPDFGDRLAGALEVPLSFEGRERARAAALFLLGTVGTVYYPPAGHAAQAAKIIISAIEPRSTREVPGLGELDLGLWQGLPEAELAHRHKDVFQAFQRDARAVVPPEAEEVDDARERVGQVLAEIGRSHRRDTNLTVIVAPEFVFTLLVAAAAGEEAPRDLWHARLAGEDVRVVEL